MKSQDESIAWTDAQPLYRVKADMFKGLAHPIRVRILELVSAGGEVPVAELIEQIGLESATLSQHLAVLRRHGLVESERRASFVYYRVTTPVVAELLRVARAFLLERLEHARDQLDATGGLPSLVEHTSDLLEPHPLEPGPDLIEALPGGAGAPAAS